MILRDSESVSKCSQSNDQLVSTLVRVKCSSQLVAHELATKVTGA